MSIGYILCGRVLKAIEIQKCGKKRKIHICWIWVLNMYRNLFGTPHKVSGTKTDRGFALHKYTYIKRVI